MTFFAISLFHLVLCQQIVVNVGYISLWVDDDSCGYLQNYSSIDALFERNQPFLDDIYYPVNYSSTPEERRKGVRVIQTCTKKELSKFDSPPVKKKQFVGVTRYEIKQLWNKAYELMANKTLSFVGDSMIYQHAVALHLFLSRELNVFSNSNVFPNGLRIIRPFLTHIPESGTEIQNIFDAHDITFFNCGARYALSNNTEVENYNHALARLFGVMQTEVYRRKAIWVDNPLPHFRSDGKSYRQYLREAIRRRETPYCVPLKESVVSNMAINSSHSRISSNVLSYFPGVANVRTYDVFVERFDAHQSYLTSQIKHPVRAYACSLCRIFTQIVSFQKKLDCLHYCMQPCLWDPVIYRMGIALMETIGSGPHDDTS